MQTDFPSFGVYSLGLFQLTYVAFYICQETWSPLFAKRKIWFISVIVELLQSHAFLCFRRRDEGASLVSHPVTWRALLLRYPPIIAKTHYYYGFPWQQPLQESLHKQHCWVNYSKFSLKRFILSEIQLLHFATVCHNVHVGFLFFLSDQSGVWGDANERPEVSVTINRLSQQDQPGHRVYGITHWWRSIHSHTESSEFLPCYSKVTHHFKRITLFS